MADEKLSECLDGMMKSDMELYERILDTTGFAFHFNNLCNLAKVDAQMEIINKIKTLRQNQKKFFATKDKEILQVCKEQEKELDKLIFAFFNPQNDLFHESKM